MDNQDFELSYAHAFTVNYKRHEANMIAFNTKNQFRSVDNGCIAHEIFHAASMLLRSRGIELSEESEEAYAYLIDWMTSIVYKIIKDNKIEIT